jgi:acetyltransferase-like isoleucine patch superfamily enzyme
VRGGIVMGCDSTLIVEDGAVVDSGITIGDNCNVTLRSQSRLINTTFSAVNHSTVEIGEGAIINSPVLPLSSVSVDNGTLLLGRRAHLMSCEVLVRFGGKMTIGTYTGIAYGSELRCEEQVDIGSYGMISYGVCIYDTNTHSVDWRERRARIEHCYPEGVWEVTKPVTSPVLIGDDVWIGKEVTITKGARIGNRCIIGIRSTMGSGLIDDDSIVVVGKPRILSRREEMSATEALLNTNV